MDAGAFGVKGPGPVRLVSGCGAIDDDPAKITQTANALGRVFSSQHFKNRVHAFALGEFADRFFIITLM